MKKFIHLPSKKNLEGIQMTKEFLSAHRYLAELKGIVLILPNENILLSNLALQEAKGSSAIENIITSQDSLYKHQVVPENKNKSDKEVHSYAKALKEGRQKVKKEGGISCNAILKIQSLIEPNRSGFRKLPGTVIKNQATDEVVYTPPSPENVPKLMNEFEVFINTNSIDPLIKMAIIHYYFESIHPFYDGNGRTGRIINILYLILNDLLDHPVLYLSRYILKNRSDYYRLLREITTKKNWTDWIIFMLKAIAVTSQETTQLIQKINNLFKEYKTNIRENHKFYSHDLINNIFSYPYTTSHVLAKDMKTSRMTATRYLDALTKDRILEKSNIGKKHFYINTKLFDLLQEL